MSKLELSMLMIVGKYYQTKADFVNSMCVCKKFGQLSLMYHYNPVDYDLNLFPNCETEYVYNLERPKTNRYRIKYDFIRKIINVRNYNLYEISASIADNVKCLVLPDGLTQLAPFENTCTQLEVVIVPKTFVDFTNFFSGSNKLKIIKRKQQHKQYDALGYNVITNVFVDERPQLQSLVIKNTALQDTLYASSDAIKYFHLENIINVISKYAFYYSGKLKFVDIRNIKNVGLITAGCNNLEIIDI